MREYLDRIEQTLMIPAAEYVPAIGDVFTIIDEARRALDAAAAAPARLWLWKNFVGGRPEYWAFDNAFPINLADGDPQTLGEPCGYAIFKPSRQGRTDVSDEQVLRRIAAVSVVRPSPAMDPQRLREIAAEARDAARYRWLRNFGNFAVVDQMLDSTEFNTLDLAVDSAMGASGVMASDDTQPTDTQMVDWLREESADLRSFAMPTGGGDADVGWRVIKHYMDEPKEREVGVAYRDDPREAVRMAMLGEQFKRGCGVTDGVAGTLKENGNG